SAVRYIDNMYGERTDALNQGVPTDRLIVEWDTTRELPVAPAPDAVLGHPLLILTGAEQGGHGESSEIPVRLGDETALQSLQCLIEIPTDITRLRRNQPALAEQWQAVVRQAFRTAFAAGYRAVGFVRDTAAESPRGYYVLERRNAT